MAIPRVDDLSRGGVGGGEGGESGLGGVELGDEAVEDVFEIAEGAVDLSGDAVGEDGTLEVRWKNECELQEWILEANSGSFKDRCIAGDEDERVAAGGGGDLAVSSDGTFTPAISHFALSCPQT